MAEFNNAIRSVLGRYVTESEELEAIMKGGPIMEIASIDSVSMVNLVADLEKEFGVRFDYETIESGFKTIESLEKVLSPSKEG